VACTRTLNDVVKGRGANGAKRVGNIRSRLQGETPPKKKKKKGELKASKKNKTNTLGMKVVRGKENCVHAIGARRSTRTKQTQKRSKKKKKKKRTVRPGRGRGGECTPHSRDRTQNQIVMKIGDTKII